jgi:hypothetical protein
VGRACGMHGRGEKCVQVLVGKPEGMRPLIRPKRRWEDEIRNNLRETGRGCVEWIQITQDRDWWQALVNTIKNLQVRLPQS